MTKLKFMLAGALTTTLATIAMAEECSHSGFYAGGQVGFGMMRSNLKIGNAKGDKLDSTGIIGGVHVGYGKQSNRFYMGIEASGNLSNTKANNTNSLDNFTILSNYKREHNYGAALRPGIVFGNVLVYAKLGLDSTKFKLHILAKTVGKTVVEVSKHRLGFVPGLGVSFPVNRHIVLGVESTYSTYRKITVKSKINGSTLGTLKNSVLDTVVRASYKW